ncbi:MAG: peptide-methionine (R)-S-oxide reductase [Comamonadaceae bacterium]|nr:peptide-methionine (R)-S-oxide reductase [Comamonadaceae bacterium]
MDKAERVIGAGLHYASPGDQPSRPGGTPAPWRSAARAPQWPRTKEAQSMAQDPQDRRRVARAAHARAVQGRAQEGHRARLQRRVLGQPPPGTYRCICCGTPLFDADDQVRLGYRLAVASGRRWRRTRVRRGVRPSAGSCAAPRSSAPRCDAHLGHVFADGPAPTGTALLPQLRGAQVRAQGLTPARCACCSPRTTR